MISATEVVKLLPVILEELSVLAIVTISANMGNADTMTVLSAKQHQRNLGRCYSERRANGWRMTAKEEVVDNEKDAIERETRTEAEERSIRLLSDFDALSQKEQSAFLAWFAGGKTLLTRYGERKDVFFGKAECEWVDFDDFWLGKLPTLGWVTVEEYERFVAKGMIGTPEAVTYRILATDKGHDVKEAYWARWEKRVHK